MEKLGGILQKILTDIGLEEPLRRAQALVIWSDVVGERISSVTEPLRLDKGRLYVKVESDVWRNELVYHKTDIIEQLNRKCGGPVVDDLIFV
ncbi:DUF721 domain-containing protein [bacterium]|nr:DUF721 domain-containing protein [bacterium]